MSKMSCQMSKMKILFLEGDLMFPLIFLISLNLIKFCFYNDSSNKIFQ
jgi:hypothetical protein